MKGPILSFINVRSSLPSNDAVTPEAKIKSCTKVINYMSRCSTTDNIIGEVDENLNISKKL